MRGLVSDVHAAVLDLVRPQQLTAGSEHAGRIVRPAHREFRGRIGLVASISVVLGIAVTAVLGLFSDMSWQESVVFTASQLLTGGSGVTPSPFWPHYLELLLELWSITAIALLAGTVAAFFHRLHLESVQDAQVGAAPASLDRK